MRPAHVPLLGGRSGWPVPSSSSPEFSGGEHRVCPQSQSLSPATQFGGVRDRAEWAACAEMSAKGVTLATPRLRRAAGHCPADRQGIGRASHGGCLQPAQLRAFRALVGAGQPVWGGCLPAGLEGRAFVAQSSLWPLSSSPGQVGPGKGPCCDHRARVANQVLFPAHQGA